MAIKTIETFRLIRDAYHEATKNLTYEQRREFFKKKAQEAAQRVAKSRKPPEPES